MAAIEYACSRQGTPQTATSATYAAITGLSLASDWSGATEANGSGFEAGKKYLILVAAHITDTSSGDEVAVKVRHGSTDFAESENVFTAIASNLYMTNYWFTVWTAVSSEGITVQFKEVGTGTATVDQAIVIALNLSDDLTENTDWLFNERAADDALDTVTWTDGASVTFTPPANTDWLVMSCAQFSVVSGTENTLSRINASGTYTSTAPQNYGTSGSPSSPHVLGLVRPYITLGAISQTFKEQALESGADRTRLHSAIFALNMNKFKEHLAEYTEDSASFTSTSGYGDNLQTGTFSPSVAGDSWIGAFFGFGLGSTSRECAFRLQVDDVDLPDGQTTDAYFFRSAGEAAAICPLSVTTLDDFTAESHTLDLDAHVDSAAGTSYRYRAIWAITMELASVDVSVGLTGSGSTSGIGTASPSHNIQL